MDKNSVLYLQNGDIFETEEGAVYKVVIYTDKKIPQVAMRWCACRIESSAEKSTSRAMHLPFIGLGKYLGNIIKSPKLLIEPYNIA